MILTPPACLGHDHFAVASLGSFVFASLGWGCYGKVKDISARITLFMDALVGVLLEATDVSARTISFYMLCGMGVIEK